MRKPICPHCDKPIRPTWGMDCPNCAVSYHKKCIRNISHCLTCAAELAPKERPPLKPGESLRIPDDRLVGMLRPYLRAVGLTLAGTSPFLFLFWRDSAFYLLAVAVGIALVGIAQVLPRFVETAHVLQPARRAVMREIRIFDRVLSRPLCSFDEVRTVRIEGEQRYHGGPKHQLDYHYDAFWIALLTHDGRHLPISGEVRTDEDEGYKVGDEYDYGGLRPAAEKAAWALGRDFWITPEVAPCNAVAGLGPSLVSLALMGLLLLAGTL